MLAITIKYKYTYIMRYLLLLSLLLYNIAIAGEEANTPKFFPYLPDIPIYDNAYVVENQSLFFDFASGRIIEHIVSTPAVDTHSFTQYYHDILPALGWKSISDTTFTRDNEQLIFAVIGSDNDNIIIKISLEPMS